MPPANAAARQSSRTEFPGARATGRVARSQRIRDPRPGPRTPRPCHPASRLLISSSLKKSALKVRKRVRSRAGGGDFIAYRPFVQILNLHTESIAKPTKRQLVRSRHCCQHLSRRRGERLRTKANSASSRIGTSSNNIGRPIRRGLMPPTALAASVGQCKHAGPIRRARFLQQQAS